MDQDLVRLVCEGLLLVSNVFAYFFGRRSERKKTEKRASSLRPKP